MSETGVDDQQQTFVEGLDFYFDDSGLMVLTARYLANRGYCCGNGCRHCPYDGEADPHSKKISSSSSSRDPDGA